MYDLGADLIKVIRAFAEATDHPSVYPTALENISYRITAVRAGGASLPTNPFTILFGSNGSSGETLTLVA